MMMRRNDRIRYDTMVYRQTRMIVAAKESQERKGRVGKETVLHYGFGDVCRLGMQFGTIVQLPELACIVE